MPPSRVPLVRPQSDASDKSTTDTITTLPFTLNQASQRSPDPHASPAFGEKPPQHTPDLNTTTAVPLPSQNSMMDVVWRPHYSPFLKFVFAIIIMIFWPWVFYGVVKSHGGIEMTQKLADIARRRPRDVDYFMTALANAISFLIGYLFRVSVTRLAQRWVVSEETDIFRLSFFSALKGQTFLWSWKVLPAIFKSATRLGLALTVTLYIAAFILITPSITALLHPQALGRSTTLSGDEIDFSSSSPGCFDWFNNSSDLLLGCSWETYQNLNYNSCPAENQIVEALELGRNYVLSLFTNDTESITLSQLDGAHFLSPVRGVVPISPDELFAFSDSPSQWPGAGPPPKQYNYTLNLQGFTSNVSCHYDTRSPATFTPSSDTPSILLYNSSCPTGKDVLKDATYPVLWDPQNGLLGYWACVTSLPDKMESYELYFRGFGAYTDMTGNMTCSVSSAQSAVFPVNYQHRTDTFTISGASSPSAPNVPPVFVRSAINVLGRVVWGAQQYGENYVAESIITSGVHTYKLNSSERSETYLRLYEAMIKGILDYQLLYSRLLFSSGSVPRTSVFSSCRRPVNGTAEYAVMGWGVSSEIALYMIPMTLVTITSLVFILIAMFTTRKLPSFDPTNPTSLIVAASGRDLHAVMESINDPEGTAAWQYQLRYNENQGRFAVASGGR